MNHKFANKNSRRSTVRSLKLRADRSGVQKVDFSLRKLRQVSCETHPSVDHLNHFRSIIHSTCSGTEDTPKPRQLVSRVGPSGNLFEGAPSTQVTFWQLWTVESALLPRKLFHDIFLVLSYKPWLMLRKPGQKKLNLYCRCQAKPQSQVFCVATDNSPTMTFDELKFIVRLHKTPGLSLSPRELPTDRPLGVHRIGRYTKRWRIEAAIDFCVDVSNFLKIKKRGGMGLVLIFCGELVSFCVQIWGNLQASHALAWNGYGQDWDSAEIFKLTIWSPPMEGVNKSCIISAKVTYTKTNKYKNWCQTKILKTHTTTNTKTKLIC